MAETSIPGVLVPVVNLVWAKMKVTAAWLRSMMLTRLISRVMCGKLHVVNATLWPVWTMDRYTRGALADMANLVMVMT